MGYEDARHRPHARHFGEEPDNAIVEAPHHLKVTLDTWGPQENCFPTLYDMLQANWGDSPSRMVEADDSDAETELWPKGLYGMQSRTGWTSLTKTQRDYVDSCFAGKTLRQALEMFTFSFLIDGCSRACTHQLVRTRIGAGMMQHGGRDNDWRHRPWVMPETIRRACVEAEAETRDDPTGTGMAHCITNWEPIDDLLGQEVYKNMGLRDAIAEYLGMGRDLYAALVDAGIPWEDARRLLWMGASTYIHIYYNYVALADVLANRLEHIMDWEINCVAQLMQREINIHCPPIFSKYLGSHSDRQKKDAFAGLESWTPVGKYPNPYERCECGHAKENHFSGGDACEVCEDTQRRPGCTRYRPVDSLPREHRAEQNPFWILSPASMAGGPIEWIPTNGRYPERLRP